MSPMLARVLQQIATVVLGKEHEIRLSLACLLANGHLLIEDLPGMGKTTLSRALAQTLGLSYNRLQCVSDMLPSDILGISLFDRTENRFSFKPGPVFTQVLLADEINRTTPKCQSALLQAMEERQISVEGETHPLPEPFFVIATQNPHSHTGTFLLPESQLDRFLMRLSLGYPPKEIESGLVRNLVSSAVDAEMAPVCGPEHMLDLQHQTRAVHLSEDVGAYIMRLVLATRQQDFEAGLSTRAAINLGMAARAWALLDGRDYTLPDDVQAVFVPVVGHRLSPLAAGLDGQDAAQRLLDTVDVLG
jgi:MoxR-like ATPase